MTYLLKLYNEKIIWDFLKVYNLKNIMCVPKILKIILSMGLNNKNKNKNKINYSDFQLISGQKPFFIKSKKSISDFKIKRGDIVGIKVTLRNLIMYEFLDKLINIYIPRIKDFKGLSKLSFDLFGNYNFGIKDQIIFPEINYDNIDYLKGMNINIITNTNNIENSFFLLNSFNFPINLND